MSEEREPKRHLELLRVLRAEIGQLVNDNIDNLQLCQIASCSL